MFKTSTKKKIKTTTLNLLEQIAVMTEGVIYAFIDQKKIKRLIKYGGKFESERLFDYLRSLERSGYIKIKPQKNSLSVKLTDKGIIKLLENSIDDRIDGRWRMLSFDIPEKLKNKRNQFRSAIKRVGFRQVQKSLWACPFIKADQVERIINYHEIKNYVAYLVVEKTDIENHLKKLFNDQI
jgi:DNA-binding transcriptional regulator PaaX